MKTIFLQTLFFLAITSISYSQSMNNSGAQTLKLSFAGLTGGEITLDTLLSGSFQFTETPSQSSVLITGFSATDFHVKSFHLTILCNGHVLKYLENNSGNKLTQEMQNEVKKYHSGCRIVFDRIVLVSSSKDINDNYNTYDDGAALKFVLK